MILSQLNALKDEFKGSLEESFNASLYAWRALKTFRENWDKDALDFGAMYERSFENTLANPLWEARDHYPKRAMAELIRRDEDLIRKMFSELFNEKLDIDGRVDRFIYHCDALRDDIMRTEPQYQKHYHKGYQMISVYLGFKYPTEYCIYDYFAWRRFMEKVGAKPAPEEREIGRFFKVMRTVWKIISKDEELIEKSREMRSQYEDVNQQDSLLLVWEFYTFAGLRERIPHTFQ